MTRRDRETGAIWALGYLAILAAVVVGGGIASPLQLTTVVWLAVGLLFLICLGTYQVAFSLAEILRVLEERNANKDA
jgi:asparagine N-glycosylation enzyme membrane subunit Stt3